MRNGAELLIIVAGSNRLIFWLDAFALSASQEKLRDSNNFTSVKASQCRSPVLIEFGAYIGKVENCWIAQSETNVVFGQVSDSDNICGTGSIDAEYDRPSVNKLM